MRDRRRLLIVLLAVLAGLGLLTIGYQYEPLETLDTETSEAVAGALPGWLEGIARLFSWLGNGPVLSWLTIAVGIALLSTRRWPDFVFLILAVVGQSLAVGYLKDWTDRLRPDSGSVIPLPPSLAFPSGHATAGIVGVGALAILAAERLPSHRACVVFWSCAAVVGVSIGLSRIAVNVHWVTDVLAGWCLGVAWLAGCLILRASLARIYEPRSRDAMVASGA